LKKSRATRRVGRTAPRHHRSGSRRTATPAATVAAKVRALGFTTLTDLTISASDEGRALAVEGLDLSPGEWEALGFLLDDASLTSRVLQFLPRIKRVISCVAEHDVLRGTTGLHVGAIVAALAGEREDVQVFISRDLRRFLPVLGRWVADAKALARLATRRLPEALAGPDQERARLLERAHRAAAKYVRVTAHLAGPKRRPMITGQVVRLVDRFRAARLSDRQAFRRTATVLQAWHGDLGDDGPQLTEMHLRLRYKRATRRR
jgi:hypothetical protein